MAKASPQLVRLSVVATIRNGLQERTIPLRLGAHSGVIATLE